jgi:hypothetical protein
MAKTYFKYAERDASNYVNWAEVGKKMSDVIDADLKRREQEKAEINKRIDEDFKFLTEAPQGQHEGQTNFILDYAEKVSETMRIQNQLLKDGKLSLKDYNLQRANILRGTEDAFEVAGKWQETYATAKEMQDNGELMNFSSAILMTNEKMGDYNSHSLYINPIDGVVSIGERVLMNPDKPYNADMNSPDYNPYTSQVVPNENSTQPISQLNNRNDQLLKKLDLDAALNEGTELLADTYQLLMAEGYNKVDDIRQHKDYFLGKQDAVNSVVGDKNSMSAVSILTDFATEIPDGYTVWNEETNKVDFIAFDQAGEDFDFTMDPNDPRLFDAEGNRNQSLILIVPDPNQPDSGRLVPELTEEQLEMAKSIAGNQMDLQVDRSVTTRTEFSSKQWEAINEQKETEDQYLVENLLKLYSGNPAEIESAIIGLLGVEGNENIRNMERTNEFIIINKGYQDEMKIPLFSPEDGIPYTEEQFITAIATHLGGFENAGQAIQVYDLLNPNREKQDLYVWTEGEEADGTTIYDDTGNVYFERDKIPEDVDQSLGVNPLIDITSPALLDLMQDLYDDVEIDSVTIADAFGALDKAYEKHWRQWDEYVPKVNQIIDTVLVKSLMNNNFGLDVNDISVSYEEDGEDSYIYIQIPGFIGENSMTKENEIRLSLDALYARGGNLKASLQEIVNAIQSGEVISQIPSGEDPIINLKTQLRGPSEDEIAEDEEESRTSKTAP